MYIAYGWPTVLSTANASSTPNQHTVHLQASSNGFLLLVSSSHLELWSIRQHKIRLGEYIRDADSVTDEGHNMHAVWSADFKTILVITSAHFIHCYTLSILNEHLHLSGKESTGLTLMHVKFSSSKKAPFADDISISNFISEKHSAALGLSNGFFYLVSWSGELLGSVNLIQEAGFPGFTIERQESYGTSTVQCILKSQSSQKGPLLDHVNGFLHLEISLPLHIIVAVLLDGHAFQCTVNKNGLKTIADVEFERWIPVSDAVCVSIASEQSILAIGSRKGIICLFDLANNTSLLRTISLYDWGYSAEDTGPVNCISWTADNNAFAVGWQLRGMAVWSFSGCRLMCTTRQSGLNSVFSPVVKSGRDFLKFEPLASGVACLAWDAYGYLLYAAEPRAADRILSFSFGKYCLNRGVSDVSHQIQLICGEDRVLIVQSDDEDELRIQHLVIPQSYIEKNWPVLHVAASKDGTNLAIAGRQGLTLHDLRSKKWRVFGDVMQEQRINCMGLLWIGKIIVICNYNETSKIYELCFYPRYHLDESSLLYRKTLHDRPIVMDVWQDYLLVAYPPFDVHVFHAKLSGTLSPSKNPVLQLVTVRELSIMTAKKQPVAMRFIPHRTFGDGIFSPRGNFHSEQGAIRSTLDMSEKQPSRCLILRMNGELSLLDLDEGSERSLTTDVELFWVTYGQPEGKANLIEEVSWLAYGHNGMQVWYPSSEADAYQLQDFLQLDPELEFDREVYPLGIMPYSGLVVGVSQRLSFSAGAEMPCFEPSPQAQTILHCLLRHLLQRGKTEEALQLARLSAGRSHFSHCLEWLLFTVFDAVVSSQGACKSECSGPIRWSPFVLLQQACDLIRNFSEYLDVVVSVARKTDGRHWADLFAAAGKSTELFDECLKRRYYRTAACYILVIEKLEGSAIGQYNALRLLQATLEESLYELAGELVRFLLRSGRDVDVMNGVPERKPGGFVNTFLFGSNFGKELSKSPIPKEINANIVTVKKILENHASSLMSRKELRELVAFVKGTQFDFTEFLQSSDGKASRLHDFASALQDIGRKLDMDALQSRLDAEFLLAHMCTVGFKEWIVVLATLLRRVEVLSDLFRGDLRLWQAYSSTLRSQAGFAEFDDLLVTVEEALATLSRE